MTYTTTPSCAHCHARIRLFECLWRELETGTVRASYALDLSGLQHTGRRLWHVGCYDPMQVPEPRFASHAIPMLHEQGGIYV
jgi:hypothetical protein